MILRGRAESLLLYIATSLRERGYPPTFREMCVALPVASTNAARYWVDYLTARGLIERDAHVSRAVRLTARGSEVARRITEGT